MNEIIRCFNYDFWCHPTWGHIHDKPTPRANCWYDPSAIVKNDNGRVDLKIHRNPAVFDYNQKCVTDQWVENGNFKEGIDKAIPSLLYAEYGVGMLWSVLPFSFGIYSLTAKLPKCNYLWPAFWLFTHTPHRPEEIDIAECYSEETNYMVMRGMCKKVFSGWNVTSCIHVGDDSLTKYGMKRPDVEDFNINPSSNIVKYSFEWTKTGMFFYCNDACVRAILDRDLLYHFTQYPEMHVIINNHIDGRFYKKFSANNTTDFELYNFEYTPL